MSADVSRDQLAALAEIKVWTLLLDADSEFAGLPPSRVRARARSRVEHLETLVADVPFATRQTILAPGQLPDAERERAFGEAAFEMGLTMRLIKAELDGVV